MPIRALFAAISALFVATSQGPQIPAPVGYVNDFAHVIPANDAATISSIIGDVRAKSGGEIVVVTLPDLGGRPIEEVALNIGRQWKVGQAGKPGDPARNSGVIILVVPKETSADGRGYVRTEVGFGAEGFITDATTGEFRDEAIPFFVRRDYGQGIELMTLRVAQRFADEFHFQLDSTYRAPEPPMQRSRGAAAEFHRSSGCSCCSQFSQHSAADGEAAFRSSCRSVVGEEGAAAGAAAGLVAAADSAAVVVGSVASEAVEVSVAADPADLGDPWRE